MKGTGNHFLTAIFLLVLVLGNLLMGYLIPRESFTILFLTFLLSFLAMLGLFWQWRQLKNWIWVFFLGLVLRLGMLGAVPSWSEDYVRFLWDGEVVLLGENPYRFTPTQLLDSVEVAEKDYQFFQTAYPLLNSPDYFSVYPPLNQLIFGISAKIADNNLFTGIQVLRLILIVFEVGVLLLFLRLFKAFSVPLRRIIFYWLNPFIIQEIPVNLHFEGIVLFLLLASIWALVRHRKFISGLFWSLAVGVKLVPLILVPSLLFFRRTRIHAFFWIGALLGLFIAFLPLVWQDAWGNFLDTLSLYQGKFEFNASVYYLAREVGYWIEGYNTIAVLTKLLSVLTIGAIFYLSTRIKTQRLLHFVDYWSLIYLVYLVLQPVVHPWYTIPLLGLSLFNGRIFGIVWSFSMIFSYAAYHQEPVNESFGLLFLEYGLLLVALAWDFIPKFRDQLNKKMNLKKVTSGLVLAIIILSFSCVPKEKSEAKLFLSDSIEAHGGQDNWDNLEQVSFRKWTKLLLEDGGVEKETDQQIVFRFNPSLSGSISWTQDSVVHILSMKDDQISYSIGGNEISNRDFLESKRSDFEAAFYAFAQPWNLMNEEGSEWSSEGIRETPLGQAKTLRVNYGPDGDIWWYYLDIETNLILGTEIQLKDHRSLVENIGFNEVGPFRFYKIRKSYRVDSSGKKLYLRADYLYDNFEIKMK